MHQPKIQTQPYPPNRLPSITFPPNYDDPVITPETIQDIQVIICLIANTLWNDIDDLKRKNKKLVRKVIRENARGPYELAWSLYELYVLSMLRQEKGDLDYPREEKGEDYKELFDIVLKHHLKFIMYEWDPIQEIIDVTKNNKSKRPLPLFLPPKVYVFLHILEHFIIYLNLGNIRYENNNITKLLQLYHDTILMYAGDLGMRSYHDSSHSKD